MFILIHMRFQKRFYILQLGLVDSLHFVTHCASAILFVYYDQRIPRFLF